MVQLESHVLLLNAHEAIPFSLRVAFFTAHYATFVTNEMANDAISRAR
jgi:hypothetical protein